MKELYYAQDGQQHGPVSESELLNLIKSGDVSRDDLVWKSGMENWQPIRSVRSLLPSETSNTPAPPDLGPYSESTGPSGAVEQTIKPSNTAGAVKYAGFWKRLFAFLIDAIIIFFPTAFIVFLLMSGGSQQDTEAAINGLGFIVGWLYYAGMESSDNQATLGKKLSGIKVTDMEGGKIGFGKASGRYFGRIVSGLIFMIGYLMAGFTEKKQALHDMMAGCLVINQ